jgi:hypothetical protein
MLASQIKSYGRIPQGRRRQNTRSVVREISETIILCAPPF